MEDKVEAAPAIYRQPFLSLARLTPGSTDRIIIVVWTGIMTEARTSLNELVCVCVCVCMCARTCVRSFLPLLLLSFFFLFFFLSFLFLVSSLLSLGAGVPMAWCLSTLPHVYRFRASFVAPPCVCRTYCHRIRYLCPLNRGVSIYIFFGLWKIWRSKNNRETRICKCMEIYYISCGKFCSKIEKDFDLSVELF